MTKHFLSIVAIFKNESHILKEWLDHYLAEGVDHFWLIDNGSTDGFENILRSYGDLVTLIKDPRSHIQVQAYNEFIPTIRDQTEWLFICDLDEFAYAKNGTLADFLRPLPKYVNGVRLPWVMFGSSGHIQQPSSVIDGFRKRKDYKESVVINTKSIVRPQEVDSFHIHVHAIRNWVVVDGRGKSVCNECRGEIDEGYIRDATLLMNHYRIQSREWFLSVKYKRGTGHTSRSMDGYFMENDYNDLVDDTLAVKRGFIAS